MHPHDSSNTDTSPLAEGSSYLVCACGLEAGLVYGAGR
jgi:hypothetical protein